MPCDAGIFHKDDRIILTKIKHWKPGMKSTRQRWVTNSFAFSASLMQEIIDTNSYIVLED